jgi:hypothetical protein
MQGQSASLVCVSLAPKKADCRLIRAINLAEQGRKRQCDNGAANWRWGIGSGKNNACIIYRNICPHITMTALAVKPSANGDWASVKKFLNR